MNDELFHSGGALGWNPGRPLGNWDPNAPAANQSQSSSMRSACERGGQSMDDVLYASMSPVLLLLEDE